MTARSTAMALRDEAVRARRDFLLLLAAGAASLWAMRALSQTETDENGNPIRLPGQTPTPDIKARERKAIERSHDQEIENRANQRAIEQQQQFQNDRAAAQQRENAVQQNFDRQRLDILNSRDKP
jgi:hypothetical protein